MTGERGLAALGRAAAQAGPSGVMLAAIVEFRVEQERAIRRTRPGR